MNIAVIEARARQRLHSTAVRLGVLLPLQVVRVTVRRLLRRLPGLFVLPLAKVGAARRTRQRTVLAWHEGRWQQCVPTSPLAAVEVMRSNLEAVAGALEAAGVGYFVIPRVSDHRHRLGVAASDQAAVAAALRRHGHPLFRVALGEAPEEPEDRVTTAATGGVGVWRLGRRHHRHTLWRVFVPRCDETSRLVMGHTHGCEVEFWETGTDAPVLHAPRDNPTGTIVPRDQLGAAAVEVDERAYPTVPAFVAGRRVEDVDFPVDLVYTWVDGGDPAWRERKAATQRRLDPDAHLADSATGERFETRDELRYSLRSVALYGDFVRHVFIVTDDQVPPWLDTDHPRVSVVSHKEIFGDRGKLPTFNSHAIESRLHHIEGLAEHYVYMNDDFFFGRRVRPQTFFFPNGLSKSFPSTALMGLGRADHAARSVDAAARNNRDLLARHFGRLVTHKFKHTPYALRRSVLFEMEEAFPDAFERTASAQFRSQTDVSVVSSLYHYYAYLTRRAAPGRIANRYVDLGSPGLIPRLDDLSRVRDWDTLCVNDSGLGGRETEQRLAWFQRFLEATWPVPSAFEVA